MRAGPKTALAVIAGARSAMAHRTELLSPSEHESPSSERKAPRGFPNQLA